MTAAEKIAAAYEAANPKPDIIVVPSEIWFEYRDKLDPQVLKNYKTVGYFIIPARKGPINRYKKPFTKTVKAVMYKCMPIVIDTEYDDLMRGHSSRRVVCRV